MDASCHQRGFRKEEGLDRGRNAQWTSPCPHQTQNVSKERLAIIEVLGTVVLALKELTSMGHWGQAPSL